MNSITHGTLNDFGALRLTSSRQFNRFKKGRFDLYPNSFKFLHSFFNFTLLVDSHFPDTSAPLQSMGSIINTFQKEKKRNDSQPSKFL